MRRRARPALLLLALLACASEPREGAPVGPARGASSSADSAWESLPLGLAPPAAEDCVAVYDPRRERMVLFGGKDDDNENVGQTWILDLKAGVWSR